MRAAVLCSGFTFLAAALPLPAVTPEESEFFEKQVRPVLVEQCYECHGPEKQKADLRVDSREALLQGSDLGPVIVPGKPEESSLIKSIRHEGDAKMPKKAPKMPAEQIAALTHWVKIGAPWPEKNPPALSGRDQLAKTHWAFQPVRAPRVPEIRSQRSEAGRQRDGAAEDAEIVRSPIDAFIVSKLREHGLEMSPPASRRTLLRRATFDLIGLPPTLLEVEAFAADESPEAFAKVVERLLASPGYGERWGRHWLDVARYADTKGYLFQEERRYGFAYTYRDWVIRALNEDLPYDQFLIQQIAGDLAPSREDARSLAAMGFLTLGRRFLNDVHDIIDDRIDVVARGTMGLTVTCARCHDHKFDPITQKDYYALHGVFLSSQEPKELPRLPAAPDPEDEKAYRAELTRLQADADAFIAAKCVEFSYALTAASQLPVIVPSLNRDDIKDFFNRADREKSRALVKKVDTLNAGPLAPPRAMVLVDGPLVTPHVFLRGNPARPGEQVPRRFLAVLSGGDPQPFTLGSGRLELAKAIASKENPLTARVIVNRVWMHHFGKGLVRTPGDFGVKGEPPTHPELLDWLASRFVEEGWSLKKLHRTIMLTAAYQQASDDQPAAARLDPENRLVWRMNRRRLDFEAMRDSLLCVAGELDPKVGGRPVELTKSPDPKRRTIYGFIDRQNLPGVFRTFDLASPDTTNPQRFVTTVPQQALFFLNNSFVIDQARVLVSKPAFKQAPAAEEQIQELYRRVFARQADPGEVYAGVQFLARSSTPLLAPRAEQSAWQYGYGVYDEAKQRVQFTPLPHFIGGAWQGGKTLPDPKLGWVMLNAQGGHPGNRQHAAIRRWTAPRDGMISIDGRLQREAEQGDGVNARVVSSRAGELLRVEAMPRSSVETKIARIQVQAGEALDFLVDCRADENSDTFQWAPVIRAEGGAWDAGAQFAGPPAAPLTPLTAWEKYAQVLLATNEFVFVD